MTDKYMDLMLVKKTTSEHRQVNFIFHKVVGISKILTDLPFAQGLLFHAVVTKSANTDTAEGQIVVQMVHEKMRSSEESINDTSVDEKQIWQNNATVAFISSIEAHIEDINHCTKKGTCVSKCGKSFK